MLKKLLGIFNFIILTALLSSCGLTQPVASTSTLSPSSSSSSLITPSTSPLSDVKNGTWTCIDKNFNTSYIDPVGKLPIPNSYEGKSKDEMLKYAESIGRMGNLSLVWATDGLVSPNGDYATYLSNKDCIGDKQTGGMSIYLLDIKTGEERILMKGEDGQSYSALWWIDNTSIFCQRISHSTDSAYVICKLTGESIPVPLVGSAPGVRAHQGNFFAYSDPENNETSIRIAYINEKGALVEYKEYKQSQGYLMGECAISSDHTKMVLKVRPDHNSATRSIVIWDFESGNIYELHNPKVEGAKNVSASSYTWDKEFLQVDFLVESEKDQHNELWQYRYN